MQRQLLGREVGEEGCADVFASVKKIKIVKKWDLSFCIGRKQNISVLALSTSFSQTDSFQTGLPKGQLNLFC